MYDSIERLQMGDFTRWRTYDHRKRPWYISHKERWEADHSAVFSWSTIYTFSTSGALGITAMGTVIQNANLVGITAVDYALDSVSDLLEGWLAGANSSITCAIACIRTSIGFGY